MKIGVVTYFNIKNYGSALQAYSLRKIVNQLGHDVVFLNVRESKPVNKIVHKLHVGVVTLAKCVLFGSARKTHMEIRRLRSKSESGFSNVTQRQFDKFLKEQLPNLTIDRLSLRRSAHTSEYGAFICGSDQIWSPLSIHLSGYKYLNFAPREKRIAYAPSFGVSSVPEYNRSFVRKMLLGFDDISVRESQGAKIIDGLIGVTPPVVLDPTMLLTGEEWRSLYKEHSEEQNNGRYALCYFFDEPEDDIIKKIVDYSRNNDLKMLVLSGNNKQLLSNGAELVDAGPWEFLRYIAEAKCVFTNSFHGSVFSILFGCPLKVFGRSHSDAVKQTSRIDTLLETVKLSECMYISSQDSITPVRTEAVCDRLVPYRVKSVEFVKNALVRRSENE